MEARPENCDLGRALFPPSGKAGQKDRMRKSWAGTAGLPRLAVCPCQRTVPRVSSAGYGAEQSDSGPAALWIYPLDTQT